MRASWIRWVISAALISAAIPSLSAGYGPKAADPEDAFLASEELPEPLLESDIEAHPELFLRPPASLTKEQMEDLLRFAEEVKPSYYRALHDYYDQLSDAFVYDPAKEALLQSLMVEREYLERTKERDPEFYEQVRKRLELESQADQIVETYRKSATDAARDDAKQKLRPLLERLFDLREAEKRHEIERLRAEITRLEARWKERQAHREMIIEQHLNERLGEPDILRW